MALLPFSEAERAALAALVDPGAPDFARYWAGCRARRLLVPRCVACGRRSWPPRAVCPRCGAPELAWEEAPGEGRLYSWTVVHRTAMEPYEAHMPYAVGIVELAGGDGVRMVGRLLDVPDEDLRIGLGLRAGFEALSDDVVVPVWRPEGRHP